MSLKPRMIEPVPPSTVEVAQAAFPRGNVYLTLRDELGTLFRDEAFADLFPACGQPGLPPWRYPRRVPMALRFLLTEPHR